MEEQVLVTQKLVNQIKALIEKDVNEDIKAEIDKLKKENQKLKDTLTLMKLCQLCKVDFEHLLQEQ